MLKAARENVADDLRLNQLYALARRRLGHPDEAIALLKTLSSRYAEDEETIGITAGALKASAESGNRDALAQARQLYAKGWQLSRERNFYLGVNAAALELWLGEPHSREHAARIAALFAQRNARLAQSGIDVSGQRDTTIWRRRPKRASCPATTRRRARSTPVPSPILRPTRATSMAQSTRPTARSSCSAARLLNRLRFFRGIHGTQDHVQVAALSRQGSVV